MNVVKQNHFFLIEIVACCVLSVRFSDFYFIDWNIKRNLYTLFYPNVSDLGR